MLDESSFQTKYNKVTPTERVLSNPNHHMVKPKGTMFYFKLVFKGKAISKPLSTDETEARAMRDALLIQYNYGKLSEKTTVE